MTYKHLAWIVLAASFSLSLSAFGYTHSVDGMLCAYEIDQAKTVATKEDLNRAVDTISCQINEVKQLLKEQHEK